MKSSSEATKTKGKEYCREMNEVMRSKKQKRQYDEKREKNSSEPK